MKKTPSWSAEEWAVAREMIARPDGATAQQISDRLQTRSPYQVTMRFRSKNMLSKLAGPRLYRRIKKIDPHRADGNLNARLPADILADREARARAAERRSCTQVFFGDPPPGYSYLDRKRQALETT